MAENDILREKTEESDFNEQKQVRRQKLADMRAAGFDPFKITKYDRKD